MTDTLDRYFLTEYPSEIKAVEDVERLSDELARLFVTFFLKDTATWPYELVSLAKPKAPSKYTFSTTAMIAFALRLAIGRIRESSLAPAALATLHYSTTKEQQKTARQSQMC